MNDYNAIHPHSRLAYRSTNRNTPRVRFNGVNSKTLELAAGLKVAVYAQLSTRSIVCWSSDTRSTFGSMQVFKPGGPHEILEFYARALLAARADMWLDQLEGQSRGSPSARRNRLPPSGPPSARTTVPLGFRVRRLAIDLMQVCPAAERSHEELPQVNPGSRLDGRPENRYSH